MEPDSSQVTLLHRVSNIVSSNLSLDEMLGEIVGLTAQVTGCDACLVYLIEGDTGEIVLRASQMPHAAELGNVRLQMGEGVTGWVAEHQSVVALSSKAAEDPRFKGIQALVEDTYEAFLSVPLVASGRIIGVINVHHRDVYQHTPEEVALATFVGEQMGGAIEKARLANENARLLEEDAGNEASARNAQGGRARQGHYTDTPRPSPRKKPICACATRAGGCAGR